MTNPALPQFNVSSSGLAGLWRLEEPSNSATYFDSSENGDNNDMSRTGNVDSVVGANETHNTGSGVNVDGNAYLSISNAAQSRLDPTTQSFTVGGWVNLNSTLAGGRMIISKSDTSQRSYDLRTNAAGRPALVWYNDGSTLLNVTATSGLVLNDWAHIVGVYDRDAGEAHIYINGQLDNTNNTDVVDVFDGTADVAIASLFNSGSPGNQWDGELDEIFFFFGRALTANEVDGVYQNGFADVPLQSGIIGVYAQGRVAPIQSGIIGVYSEGKEPPLQSGIIGTYSEGQEPPLQSGIIGVYAQGTSQAELASGIIGVYAQGTATETIEDIEQEFDGRFFVEVDTTEDFDAETRVTNSNTRDFDAQIRIFRTSPAADVCIFDPSLSGVALSINSNFDFQASGTVQGDRRMIYGRWTFGDFTANSGISELSVLSGKISGVFTTSHVYTTSGIFYTKVEIMDDIGVRSDDDVRIIVTNGQTPTDFLNIIPQVSLSGTPTSGAAPLSVTYTHNITNLGNRSPITKLLDFGDGAANVGSLEPNIIHNYSQIGRYVPVLTILFDDGLIVSDSLLVNPNT